jgi:meso-butanediol dehydrogenase/(S,S)-butanediol dehydrogenase/diacetyl reductase
MGKLEDRVAIVTGGGRGIGRGISLVLAREGAAVVIADLDLESATATVAEIRQAGGRAEVVRCDVTDTSSAGLAVQSAIDAFGRVDILVNNAGVLGTRGGRDVTLDDWDMVLDVNLKGIWIMSEAITPHFKSNGGGKIVNIASIAGRQGGGVHPHYSASKAGAISLTQSLAMSFGPRNINVNAVCPGLVRTDMWQKLEGMVAAGGRSGSEGGWIDSYISTSMPLRREQTPEDIGMAVAFLASDEARNITGQALNVDGGLRLN